MPRILHKTKHQRGCCVNISSQSSQCGGPPGKQVWVWGLMGKACGWEAVVAHLKQLGAGERKRAQTYLMTLFPV